MEKERLKEVLGKVLKKIELSAEEEKELNGKVNEFIKKLKARARKDKIKADFFLGGSVAKKTLIRKEKYDADIFLMLNEKTKEENISGIIKKLSKFDDEEGRIVKGSRDYLQFEKGNVVFEVIPVIRIKKPKDARNVTDLSAFHVKYVLDCIKKKPSLAREIKLAKAFSHASGCYGAESYIKGFSGYGIELLVCHYKSFLNFIRKIAEAKDRIVIDPAKHYKNAKEVMSSLNEAKLESIIVLVDPTFRERNALAALSKSTFLKFRQHCRGFLKNPAESKFEQKKINKDEIKGFAEKKGLLFAKFAAFTNKQAGDIAGSKLLKFYGYFSGQIEKCFEIIRKEFEYSEKDYAGFYFVLKERKEIIVKGPPLDKKENVEKFKAKYKENFVKENRVYAKKEVTLNLSQFFRNFQTENKKLMLDMGIKKFLYVTTL